MKTLKYTLLMCLLFITSVASAQITRISGNVSDDFDALPGAAVQEIDGSNRIINATVTDMNGNFTMSVKSTKNKLKVSFIGYKTQVLAINKTTYKIKLADNTVTLRDVNVTAKKMTKGTGLSIPEREVTYSVQGLDAKEFEGLGITSVDEALQGRIAGLDIVANSGDLGAGSQIHLRGMSSLGNMVNSQPTIVVNGQIMDPADTEGFDAATANEETFGQLLKVHPEDILDIKVLKDASATAIWGVHGANGVIEITTKRGKAGPTRIQYSGKLTLTHQPDALKMLNGDQYTMMLKEAFFNPQLNDRISDEIPEINYRLDSFSEAYMYDNNTDWVGMLRQTGMNQSHNINMYGGDEKVEFRVSGGYDHNTGTVIKQNYDRFSTRMALDYKVSDRIKIISNFSMLYTTNKQTHTSGLADQGYSKMPNLSPYYEYVNGVPSSDYYYMMQEAGGPNHRLSSQLGIGNPLALANLKSQGNRSYELAPELELEYKLLGLNPESHQLRYNGNIYLRVNSRFEDIDEPRDLTTKNYLDTHSASSTSNKQLSFTTRHTLNFIPHFNNRDHYLTAMARFELSSNTSTNQSTKANRVPTGVTSPSAGGIIPDGGLSTGYGEGRSMAGLITAHYSYLSRYSIGGTIRMDGTTKLGPNKRWNPSYQISGRWNAIDEPFMKFFKEKAKVSMFGVSLGWGVNYSLPTKDYLYMNHYSAGGSSYLGISSMKADEMRMTNFTAQKTNEINLGVRLGLWDDRLTVNVDMYDRIVSDLISEHAGASTATGWGYYLYKNIGKMENKGVDIALNANRLVKINKFSIDAYMNFNKNRNNIVEMDPIVLEQRNTKFEEPANNKVLNRVQINNPCSGIYGFRSHGVYQYNFSTAELIARDPEKYMPEALKARGFKTLQDCLDAGVTFPVAQSADGKVILNERGIPLQMKLFYKEGDDQGRFNGGDAIYEDVNHDGQINELDLVYLGSSLPKLVGGFGLSFNYGRWRLSSQFTYRLGFDILNLRRLENESMSNTNNQSQAVNYRWRKEGDITTIPRAMMNGIGPASYNTMISDRFLEDGSFMRLNFLQLSYNFDNKLTKKWGINNLRLSASAQNVFVLTGYTGMDPEIGATDGGSVATDRAQTPRSKTYTFNVSIEF